MADNKTVTVPQEQPVSSAPSTIQLQSGNTGKPTPSGYPGQPAQPTHPAEGGQPPQQHHYPGPYPLATAQPGYHPQTVQSAQQTSVVIIQPCRQITQAITVPVPPRPPSYLGLSICLCLCCNSVIGLIAIIFSCMVNSAYDRGDYERAKSNSNVAKLLNSFSYLLGLCTIVALIVIFIPLNSNG